MKRFTSLFTTLTLIFAFILNPALVFADTLLNGLDVSAWQGSIDFEAVKNSGVEVVYIRAAYGYNEDSYFEQNYQGAKDAGLLVGFYHYITPSSVSDAENQAQYFYNLIRNKSMDYPPAMDFESFPDVSNYEINTIAASYIETLENLVGVIPAIYSDDSNISNLWSANFAKYPLWVAEYGVNSPQTLGNWNSWMGFQYSESGSNPGMSGNSVDLDYFWESGRISNNSNTHPSQPVSNYHLVYTTYRIQWGDNIFTIAKSQGATVQQIIKANNLKNPSLLIAGHTLRIPHWVKKSDTSSNGTYQTTYTTYVVQAGNTLSQIAYNHGATLEQLIRANNISNPNLIYVGQVLRIPHWTKVS